MRATWLADVLREAGCRVYEMPGWLERETRSGFEPIGLVWHYTVTGPNTQDVAVDRLLRDGRRDLPGPLSQLGLRRDGTFVVVAAGRCNHNGYGTWGNDSFGIEAYNDGVGEVPPPAQMVAWRMGSAAICKKMGWPATTARLLGHKETDPARKIDPPNIDMFAERLKIDRLLTPSPLPAPTPPPAPQEDDMASAYFTYEYPKDKQTVLILVHHGKQVRLTSQDELVKARKRPDHLYVQEDEAQRFGIVYGSPN